MTNDEAARLGLAADTPRLVVSWRRGERGEEFQWGVQGTIPPLSLIGAIGRVQRSLQASMLDDGSLDLPASRCIGSEQALVLKWDEGRRWLDWWVHPGAPVDALCGMLEVIGASLAGAHAMRRAAAQQIILGPDGLPIKR